jgi:Na+-translocating ferredoxin:NAD+ oxidoreductase RnfE subunit
MIKEAKKMIIRVVVALISVKLIMFAFNADLYQAMTVFIFGGMLTD